MSAVEMWCLLTAVFAVLIGMILQVRRTIIWWSATVAVGVSVIGTALLPLTSADLAREAVSNPGFFSAIALVLILGLQLSRLISRFVGKVLI